MVGLRCADLALLHTATACRNVTGNVADKSEKVSFGILIFDFLFRALTQPLRGGRVYSTSDHARR